MGMMMTIEEAKEHLSQYIGDNRVDYDDLDAIEVAVNVIQKYQKIEQIVNNYISSGKPYISVIDEDIRKVLEDGNNI